MNNENQQLLDRIARLEGAIGWVEGAGRLSHALFGLCSVLIGAGIFFAYRGLGTPNHYYQGVMAVLFLLVAYQRRILRWPSHLGHWVLTLLNAVGLTLVMKILLGGGERFPFYWLKYPFLSSQRATGKLLNVFPDFQMLWEPTPLALWSVDLTVVQSFLVLLVLLGGAFGLQIFVSLVGFLLVLVSLPALLSFDWTWVFPALVSIGVGLYLQSSRSHLIWKNNPSN
ncbi:MAG: hypothetical protein H6617_03745 [Bdellovibrionaceae bacterium]|nr:hypothetical protein [Bdellovibrionales bacterium]MCB9253772.1 hypothetical protein [Pseudobdellovibrionaceae bacterium]